MHASYLFLVDKVEGQSVEEILGQFADYAEVHCDENNWSEVYGLVFMDQNKAVSALNPSRLEKEGDEGEWVAAMNASGDPWGKTVRFALEITATDMGLFGLSDFSLRPSTPDAEKRLESLTNDELIAAILRDIPEQLAAGWKIVPHGQSEAETLVYRLARLTSMFKKFHVAKFKPFDLADDPYAYRCYDLRDNIASPPPEMGDGAAILLVDIHT